MLKKDSWTLAKQAEAPLVAVSLYLLAEHRALVESVVVVVAADVGQHVVVDDDVAGEGEGGSDGGGCAVAAAPRLQRLPVRTAVACYVHPTTSRRSRTNVHSRPSNSRSGGCNRTSCQLSSGPFLTTWRLYIP